MSGPARAAGRPVAGTFACIAACVGAWLAGNAAANNVVTTAHDAVMAVEATGARYRDDVNRAFQLAFAGDLDQALARVRPALAYCDGQMARDDMRFVSVVDAAQYRLYLEEHGDGSPTEWLDIACAGAYTVVGFVHAGRKEYEAALPPLDRAIAIAPYYPDALTEKGFVLNQLGRHDAAIDAYRAAIALVERHRQAASMKALALRGIGYALIEQGDLDGAQRTLEESLVLDPGNRTALGELDYIAKLRASRSPPAP